jgi:hypothetical protein
VYVHLWSGIGGVRESGNYNYLKYSIVDLR